MTAQEPAWKLRSRPCPFYSQGRCLFGDSCNFLHSAEIGPDSETTSIITPSSSESAFQRSKSRFSRVLGFEADDLLYEDSAANDGNGTPFQSPGSRAESPWSAQSPNRSPRLSGLLFALRSVIGPDEDEGTDEDTLDGGLEAVPNLKLDGVSFVDSEDYSLEEFAPAFDSEGEENVVPDEETQALHALAHEQTDGQPTPLSQSQTSGVLEPPRTPLDVSFNSAVDTSSISFLSDFPAPPSTFPFQDSPTTSTPPNRSPSHNRRASSTQSDSFPPQRNHSQDSVDGWNSPLTKTSSRPSTVIQRSPPTALSSPFQSPTRVWSSKSSSAGGSPTPASNVFSNTIFSSPENPTFTIQHETSFDWDSRSQSEQRDVEEEDGVVSSAQLEEVSQWKESVASPVSPATVRPRSPTHTLAPDGFSSDTSRDLTEADLTIDAVTECDGSFENSTLRDPWLHWHGLQEREHIPSSKSDHVSSPSVPQDVFADENGPSSSRSISPSSPTRRLTVACSPEPGTVLGCSSSPASFCSNSTGASETLVESDPSISEPEKSFASTSKLPASFIRQPRLSGFTASPLSSFSREVIDISSSPDLNRKRPLVQPISTSTDKNGEVSKKVPFGFRHSFSLGQSNASSLMKNRRSRKKLSRPSIPPVVTDFSQSPQSDADGKLLNTPSSDGVYTPSWMKPLRLSQALSSPVYSDSRQSLSLRRHSQLSNELMQAASPLPRSSSVLSDYSLSDNRLLSSTRSSLIPEHIRTTLLAPAPALQSTFASDHLQSYTIESFLQSASPSSYHSRERSHRHHDSVRSQDVASANILSPLSGSMSGLFNDDNDDSDDDGNDNNDDGDDTYRLTPLIEHPSTLHAAPPAGARPPSRSALRSPLPTPRPALLFAIASDDAAAVRRVLESGEAGADEQAGPQSMLAFALTNARLVHRRSIVRALLAHGADASALGGEGALRRLGASAEDDAPPGEGDNAWDVDPVMQYYLSRANAPHIRQAAALLGDTVFRAVARAAFDLIGQDRALEELCRVLKMHAQLPAPAPLVMMFCGPNGHGKSLLARRFGCLLDVPTHTVNMTSLQHTHDLWQAPSMSPDEEFSDRTLAEFLIENEGKACVVVLDDIDKAEDERNLWSLLTPWELGRWSGAGPGQRAVDVRHAMWIATSNIGQDVIDAHDAARAEPHAALRRDEYLALAARLRPRVGAQLGASLVARVAAVLPFVPFTRGEQRALAADALLARAPALGARTLGAVCDAALAAYVPAEGARGLQRAAAAALLDVVDRD